MNKKLLLILLCAAFLIVGCGAAPNASSVAVSSVQQSASTNNDAPSVLKHNDMLLRKTVLEEDELDGYIEIFRSMPITNLSTEQELCNSVQEKMDTSLLSLVNITKEDSDTPSRYIGLITDYIDSSCGYLIQKTRVSYTALMVSLDSNPDTVDRLTSVAVSFYMTPWDSLMHYKNLLVNLTEKSLKSDEWETGERFWADTLNSQIQKGMKEVFDEIVSIEEDAKKTVS